MEAIKFDPKMHYDEICEWAMERDIPQPPIHLLPSMGRIVHGKCALFIYQTDCRIGFIENLITKYREDPESLSDAISLCFTELEKDALAAGIEFLWGSTFIPGVADRAKEHGFHVRPERYRLMTKKLSPLERMG